MTGSMIKPALERPREIDRGTITCRTPHGVSADRTDVPAVRAEDLGLCGSQSGHRSADGTHDRGPAIVFHERGIRHRTIPGDGRTVAGRQGNERSAAESRRLSAGAVP